MIVNRQRRLRVPVKELGDFLARVQNALGIAGREVTVALVGDSEIARLNRTFRRKNRATDVLSFPASDPAGKRRPSAEARYLGDIAIAAGVARGNARRNRRRFRDELCVLVLHGVLHLLGYDHETDNGRMTRLELRLRRRLRLE
jgi:probable rRNA maturation factor